MRSTYPEEPKKPVKDLTRRFRQERPLLIAATAKGTTKVLPTRKRYVVTIQATLNFVAASKMFLTPHIHGLSEKSSRGSNRIL